ncbi:MAG: TetR family transcriptional regulator C-terminal domain-containing protein [Clostridia bacterium]|nr:TetR family transcriptional regulator C-terminal domain-containing protein [Clostridia bacterium]
MTNLTKDLIKKTFVSLLERMPLTQITVKMIVEECGINRNSFYYNYQDLPALMEEIVREEADGIIKQYPNVESIETALLAATDFASKNKKAILHIYNSVNRDIFERYLWEVCDHVVESYGQTLMNGRKIDKFDKEIIHLFYKSECFGLVINWLDRKMEPDVRKLISRFCELHRGVIEGMIDRSING